MSGFSSTIYNVFFRSNTVMLGTIFAGAFGMQLGFDSGSQILWDKANKGRQWKDIKAKYVEAAEED